jgi:hypothetical protein
MSGTARIARNAADLLDLRLIVAHAEESAGHTLDKHPIAAEPDSVIVTTATGRPSFLYATANGVLSDSLWGAADDRVAQEIYIEGSLISVRRYSQTGCTIEEITDLKDGPRWES